jgi:hypothetical protein
LEAREVLLQVFVRLGCWHLGFVHDRVEIPQLLLVFGYLLLGRCEAQLDGFEVRPAAEAGLSQLFLSCVLLWVRLPFTVFAIAIALFLLGLAACVFPFLLGYRLRRRCYLLLGRCFLGLLGRLLGLLLAFAARLLAPALSL